MLHYFPSLSPVLLFWVAFVLTRPFGATSGDLLTKSVEKHGLGFSTQDSVLILLVALVVYDTVRQRRLAAEPLL